MRAPKPADAVHIAPNGRRSLCGQSMTGERELPAGTAATCPVLYLEGGAAMTSLNAPIIVTICGSTRFRTEIAAANRRLTLAGAVVLAPGVFAHAGDVITEAQKSSLDALHLEKIRLSQAVLVVNPAGYIGESTAREVMYARDLGRRIWFLDQLDQAVSVITQLQFSISTPAYGEER